MASHHRAVGGRSLALTAALSILLSAPAFAQQESVLSEEAYLEPAPEITRIITAPRHENVSLNNLSPDRRHFLHTLRSGLPTLADYAKPFYRLGGFAIDTSANRARGYTTVTEIGYEVISWEDGRRTRIMAPSGAKVSTPKWSPDGKSLSYFVHLDDGTYLYVADLSNGRSRRVTRTPILATIVFTYEWTADSRSIVAVFVPEGRGRAPRRPEVPTEPIVRLTSDGENRLRTFSSLLADPYEQELLEYHITGQLGVVDISRGRVRKVGKPAMFRRVDPAPNGDYFRVTTIQKPFSYIVPVSNFGTIEEIWDLDGKVLTMIKENPVNEGIRQQDNSNSGSADRRGLTWRPDGQGLSYLQLEPAPQKEDQDAQDQDAQRGDPQAGDRQAADSQTRERTPAQRKDRVMQWLPPFDSTSAQVVYESESRLSRVQYSTDPNLIFLTESSRGTSHLYAVALDEPSERYTISRHRSEDFYENPGTLMQTRVGSGNVVHITGDGGSVYLSGTTYSKTPLEEAPRPFIDRVEIRSGEKERIFESSAEHFERVTAIVDDELPQFVISRESPTMIPDYYLIDRGSGEERKLTANVDHSPELTAAQRRIIEVTRADGFKFWVKVTLPAEYTPGTRLPALFWFYPSEFTSQEAYDRTKRAHNKNQFPRIGPRTMEIMTRAGYAVIEPDAPIIGPSGRMNDFYIHDLRNNLSAVIDELDKEGLIDRSRLALGGHSYGAFSTANAMIHTPFFKAGIAGDGNANRTLTPLGFQTERRDLWEARETYLEMSPFLYAERLTGALLMYHGADDQNAGTHLMHSERLFHGLNGLGKTAALYVYPYEDHGPVTRETLLDLWTRWVAWLDKYLKDAGAEATAEVAAEG